MCHERLELGQSPACVQSCPSGAIEIEVVNVEKWLNEEMNEQANAPFLPDAKITNSTTRYTLPKNMPEIMKEMDEHLLKPAHPEIPLVFMTVLTQISLGGFLVLFLGDVLSLFGYQSPNWIMAALVALPAAIGLPLSALHLGRPFLAMTAMKNLKTSWLSREALALGVFTALMSGVVALYFFKASPALRLIVEATTLAIGIFGIYAQSMIYRIRARPSWNRPTTNLKFFGVAYVGAFAMALASLLLGFLEIATPLLALGMLGALAQTFFTYEDLRTLNAIKENEYQLKRTTRLYDENFSKIKTFRFLSIGLGGVILPLLTIVLLSSASLTSAIATLLATLALTFASEISDRFLFYSTVVPLGMAGGFFVGKQRS